MTPIAIIMIMEFTNRLRLQSVVIRHFRSCCSETVKESLTVKAGRHKNLLMTDILCVFYIELYIIVLENQYHVIVLCPAYTELRSKYLYRIHLTSVL